MDWWTPRPFALDRPYACNAQPRRADTCQHAGIAHSATCRFLEAPIYRAKYRYAAAVLRRTFCSE
jgi:hypothetical protein